MPLCTPPLTPMEGQPGAAAVSPHPCVCLSTLFRRHTSLPAPTPVLEAPVAVCMLVTVVQNKFYLSLLYPELDLPRLTPDRAQWYLSPLPHQSCWVWGHLQGQTTGPGATSPGFLPMALPFPPPCLLSLHMEKNVAWSRKPRFASWHRQLVGWHWETLTSLSRSFHFCKMGVQEQ